MTPELARKTEPHTVPYNYWRLWYPLGCSLCVPRAVPWGVPPGLPLGPGGPPECPWEPLGVPRVPLGVPTGEPPGGVSQPYSVKLQSVLACKPTLVPLDQNACAVSTSGANARSVYCGSERTACSANWRRTKYRIWSALRVTFFSPENVESCTACAHFEVDQNGNYPEIRRFNA